MVRTRTISHNGKTIFHMDFSGLTSEQEIESVIEASKLYIRNQPKGTTISLTNIHEMHFNNEIKELFTEFVKGNKPYVKASAIVGASGLKQVLFNGIMKLTGRDVKSFSNENQAMKWLDSQD